MVNNLVCRWPKPLFFMVGRGLMVCIPYRFVLSRHFFGGDFSGRPLRLVDGCSTSHDESVKSAMGSKNMHDS